MDSHWNWVSAQGSEETRMMGLPEGQTRSSADADNALDANEAGIRVIRGGVPNFRKSIT